LTKVLLTGAFGNVGMSGLEELLTEYGLLGGTHHISMTRGDRRDDLEGLASLLGIETRILR